MKALFLSHSAAPSGAELSLFRLATATQGIRPVIWFAKPGPMVRRFQDAGLQVLVGENLNVDISRDDNSLIEIFRSGIHWLREGWTMGGSSELCDVDVVIARSVKSLIIGWPLARRIGKPLVWSVHDRMSAAYLGRVKAFLVKRLAVAAADAVIANSESTMSTVDARKKPHIVIYPGLDESLLQENEEGQLPEHPLRVVNVGRLAEWKGQHIFLQAFEEVFADSDARAVVVGGALFGERDYEAKLHGMAETMESGTRVEFTGHVDDVRSYLSQADIVVHSSIIPEPFGSVIVEGMALGKPVIATRPGGPEEIITDGTDGLLVPCGDDRALAHALYRLSNDSDERRRFGHAARETARRFGNRNQVEKLERWLETWLT